MKVLPRGDRKAVEGVLQVLLKIDADLLAGLGEAGQEREGPSAPVRAEKNMCLAKKINLLFFSFCHTSAAGNWCTPLPAIPSPAPK